MTGSQRMKPTLKIDNPYLVHLVFAYVKIAEHS